MGGKSSTTSQSVKIPPEVLARYNAVNTRAEAVATQPFQKYSTSPDAFVAPINQQQYAGIGAINNAAGLAQPYYGTAAGMTLSGAASVNPEQYSAQGVQRYMNPYISNVADTTAAQMRNLYGQQAEELKGGAIRAGAFGGDRAGIAQGNLANQQGLAFGQNMANIYGQGFNQAQQQFNQQQGVNLQAEQANQARMLAAGQQLAGLGGAAQQSALQGAQAMLGAGTLQQQTEQAGKTALYNQFQQQQAYPFQVAQFLGNLAMGTGALSGSTTTTTQPAPFFSDERMKDNIERIGKTFDGQDIVKFNYKGDKQKQIGLIAQDVEKHHPEAVGLAGGMKTVDYDGATKHAARMGKFAGGLSTQSMGGTVIDLHRGEGYAVGGAPQAPAGLQNVINQQMSPMNLPQLAEDARGLAPQFQTPAAVSAPVFNPQPVAGSGGKEYTNWNDYITGLTSGRDMNDPSVHPYVAPPADVAETSSQTSKKEKSHHHEKSDGFQPNPSAPNWDTGETQTYGGGSDMYGVFANGGRAGYATQGSVNDPYDPYSLTNILNRSQAMYANMPHPGIYGKGDFSGLPHGAKSHVPQGNLPIRELKTAGPIPEQQPSTIEQGMSAIDKAQKIAGMFDKSDPTSIAGLARRASGAKLNNDGKTFDNDGDPRTPAARGGFLAYASGGTLPYGYGDMLDIPNDKSEIKLPTAGKFNNPDSSLSNLATAVSLGKTILSFLPLATGGRTGYAPGGTPPEDDLRSYTLEQAKKYKNIDPDFAVKVFHGESGFNPMQPGDENSSFGVPQLHYGNVSQRYPRSGLGDQFTKETGYDLRDPEVRKNPDVQKKAIDWSLAYADKNGWNDWTVAKNLMANESSSTKKGLAGSPTESKTMGWMAQAPEGGMEKFASAIGIPKDYQDSALWIPAMAGIGSMLSSRSPYFLPALGEGLVGAAAAYPKARQAQADLEQTRTATMVQDMAATRGAIENIDGILVAHVFDEAGNPTTIPYSEYLDNKHKYSLDLNYKDRGEGKATGLSGKKDQTGTTEGTTGLAPPVGTVPTTEQKTSTAETPPSGAPTPTGVTPPTSGTPEVKKETTPARETPPTGLTPPTGETTPPVGEKPRLDNPVFFIGGKLPDPIKNEVVQNVNAVRSMTNTALSDYSPDKPKNKIYQDAAKLAANSALLKGALAEIVGLNSSLAATGAPVVAGSLAPALKAGLDKFNAIARTLNMPGIAEKDLSDMAVIQKTIHQLGAAAAAAGNQEAERALGALEQQYPNFSTDPKAAALGFARALQLIQKPVDRSNYFANIEQTAKSMLRPGDADRSAFIPARMNAAEKFERDYQQQYEKDVQILDLFQNHKVKDDDGRDISYYQWLFKHGERLPPEYVKSIANEYGADVLRYIPSIPQQLYINQ